MPRGGDLTGWERAGRSVATGAPPPGTWTLERLADAAGQERLLLALLGLAPDQDRRQSIVTIVHYGLHTIGNILLAPMIFDDVAIDVAADQVGAVIAADGDLAGFWIGTHHRLAVADPVAHTGALAMRLVGPIAATARRTGPVPSRGLQNVILDSLHGSCEWFERSLPASTGEPIAARFLAAAGPPDHRLGRLIAVDPDAGPPVELRVPRTCCVLKTDPGCHACPTCPQYPDDDVRVSIARDWLRGLDDDAFRSVTGRPRITRAITSRQDSHAEPPSAEQGDHRP